jgi:hypothetical protein
MGDKRLSIAMCFSLKADAQGSPHYPEVGRAGENRRAAPCAWRNRTDIVVGDEDHWIRGACEVVQRF